MKKSMIFLLITLILITGCSFLDKNNEQKVGSALDKEMGLVSVKLSGGSQAIFKKDNELEAFQNAVNNAKKIEGILDVMKSNYEFDLIFSNGEAQTKSYFLWLDPTRRSGMIMDQEDTHTGYTLKSNDAEKLVEIIKDIKVNLENRNIEGISVSRVGEDMIDIKSPHVKYTQENKIQLQTFVEAITRAKKQNGVVKIGNSDYILDVAFEDQTNSQYMLWLNSERGLIMNNKDTHTLYDLPADVIKDLNSYVK
ncbi:hypothetical protein [Fictibacillus arsenicus]|uniref:YhfM-like domain-containing protein n=1 Tax=Fictibacillus arsenicus TaxID=255247 RepID=A0A1V3GCJ7_9BACL|nr:hypothetical protein [Fictibacillus arsenicus]OOE14432.1 hypothetical protein UN64_04360 [Fictibacillus arsenicus]